MKIHDKKKENSIMVIKILIITINIILLTLNQLNYNYNKLYLKIAHFKLNYKKLDKNAIIQKNSYNIMKTI